MKNILLKYKCFVVIFNVNFFSNKTMLYQKNYGKYTFLKQSNFKEKLLMTKYLRGRRTLISEILL